MVWESYKKVRANKGSSGVDGVSLQQFEEKLSDNLYKVWNRLSSGSYFPPAVKEVEIPKKDGGKRLLGIPTVGDRVAQMVVKDYLEPRLEKEFLNQSYGYLKSDKKISELSGKRRLEIEGEARISRAMCHFRLLECYGQFFDLNSEYGVVIKMSASREIEAIKRSTVKQTYDSILVDLNFGIANAPVVSPHDKFSQTLAKAHKAKVLLYMGEYADAASVALDAMGDANYKLEDTYQEIFAKGYKAREVLFSPYMVYEEKSNTWTYAGFYCPVAQIETMADNEKADEVDGGGNVVKRYDLRYEFTHKGSYSAKYPFYPSSAGDQSNSIINMRMAEVYLIYAEAMARTETGTTVNAEAKTRLNEIRSRSGMPAKDPATKAELLEAIRIEKNMELHNEMAQPWFDMIRYHVLEDIKIGDIKATITSRNQFILPIPKTALASNNKLEQNPGYAGTKE